MNDETEEIVPEILLVKRELQILKVKNQADMMDIKALLEKIEFNTRPLFQVDK